MSNRDAQVQLNDLEEEEARIMRELRDLDDKAQAETEAKRRRQENLKEDPDVALSQLLLECEKEVRDAKGYIADNGPPLKIVRVRHGETAPKGATYLSRPRNTGVDFTIPLTTKVYTDVIKKPIFLNQMREKMKAKEYTSSEDYLEDMRLLARNTAAFNKTPELSWVVQHARFLLEAAEDAVTARRRFFYDVEDALRQQSINKQKASASLHSVGKRKRSSAGAAPDTNGDAKGFPSTGTMIEVYWPNYRKWFAATIQASQGANVHVVYEEDGTDQWVNLEHGLKWRIKATRGAASSKSKRAAARHVSEPPASKKRKAGAAHHDAAPVVVTGGVTLDDFNAMSTDMHSMINDLRENLTARLIRHVETMDHTLHRSDHLQRVLLAVDDTRGDMQAFMEKVDKRCARMEDLVSQLTGTSIKPIENNVEKAGSAAVQEHDNSLNKESNGDRVVEVTDKDEPPKRAVEAVEEVIEIDDASTDKPDDVQVVKTEKAATSKPAEDDVTRAEKGHATPEKNVEELDSESRAPEKDTNVDDSSAIEVAEEKAQSTSYQKEGAAETAQDVQVESTATQPEPDGTARSAETVDARKDEKAETSEKPETSAKQKESESNDNAEVEATAAKPVEREASEKADKDVADGEEPEKESAEAMPDKPDETKATEVEEVAAKDSKEADVTPESRPVVAEKAPRGVDGRKTQKEDEESSDGSDGSDDSDGSESDSSSDGDGPDAGAKRKDGKAKAGDTGGKKPLAAVQRKTVPVEKDVADAGESKPEEPTAEQDEAKKKPSTAEDSDQKMVEASSDGNASPDRETAAKETKSEKENGEESGSDMDVEPAT